MAEDICALKNVFINQIWKVGIQMSNKFKIVNAGNLLDFLEFSLFSSLLPLITNDLIYNHNSSEKASLAYLLFFIGFLGRPLGAMIFGYLGDIFGRRKALVLSLIGMSCSTFLFGIIPNFYYSYILIAIIRFVQGVFTGGEYANATVYVIENVSSRNRFCNAANLTASGIFGASIGQAIGMLVSSDIIPFLNWRLVFIIVSIFSMYVAIMRTYHIPDNEMPNQRLSYDDIKKYLYSRYVVMGIIFGGIMNGLFYLMYTFIGTYNSIIKNQFVVSSYFISLLSSLMLGGSLILWSRSAILEKYNSSQFIKISLLVMISLLYPMYVETSSGNIGVYSLTLIMLFISFMQLFTLITIKSIPENLPTHCRVLLSGLPISLGGSIIGGASPYVSSKLITATGNENSPVLYFIVLMLTALLIINFWPIKNVGEKNDIVFE